MKFTFARVVIFLCVVLSGALGVLAWSQQQKIGEMREALGSGGEIERLTREIQQFSRKHTDLSRQAEGDLLTGEDKTPESYIRSVAYRDDVRMGQIEVDPDERDDKNFVDMIYRINADDKEKKFSRLNLANFFYKLEEKEQPGEGHDARDQGGGEAARVARDPRRQLDLQGRSHPPQEEVTSPRKRSAWRKLLLLFVVVGLGAAMLEVAIRARHYLSHGSWGPVLEFATHEPSGLPIPVPGRVAGPVQIDSRGFRNPELEVPKPEGRLRVAFLGGSTTFCAEAAAAPNTWPARVARKLAEEFPERADRLRQRRGKRLLGREERAQPRAPGLPSSSRT